jgi:hypothetical protein
MSGACSGLLVFFQLIVPAKKFNTAAANSDIKLLILMLFSKFLRAYNVKIFHIYAGFLMILANYVKQNAVPRFFSTVNG